MMMPALIIERIYRFYNPGLVQRLYRLITGLIFSALFVAISVWILLKIFPEESAYHTFVMLTRPLRFSVGFVLLAYLTVVGWLRNVIREEETIRHRLTEAQQLARDTELQLLRNQLQPHFLFNSLNSVSALITLSPVKAREMIVQLSDFFRSSLQRSEHDRVSLKEEMRLMKLYLDIEKVRFGERLKVIFDVPEHAESISVPVLILQPLIENAVKFGVYGNAGEVIIRIRAERLPGMLNITVSNPLGKENNPAKGTGFGLASLRRRLDILYPGSARLRVESCSDSFIATLTIPEV